MGDYDNGLYGEDGSLLLTESNFALLTEGGLTVPTNPDVTAPVPCFYSTVRNITANSLSFGFLGEHGKRLTASQQYTVRGNIIDRLACAKSASKRKFNALERAVMGYTNQAGVAIAPTLEIIQTPAPILKDTATHAIKQLKLTSGTLGIADPCGGAYTST